MRYRRKSAVKTIFKYFFLFSNIAIILFIGYVAWQKLFDTHSFPFQHVKVILNESPINSAQLKKTIIQNLKGGFFSLKKSVLKDSLLEFPWIANVSFRRVWPDTLVIVVEEQQALARWNTDAVFNDKGETFNPPLNTISDQLPLLIGVNGAQKEIFDEFFLLQKKLSDIDLVIRSLELSSLQVWQMILTNGVKVIIGQADADQQINRFIQLYPKLIKDKTDQVEYVDLRYPNGLVIRWKRNVNEP